MSAARSTTNASTRPTAFTEALGIRYPLISAGMGMIARPPLVVAVSNAGGLGMLGASPAPVPIVAEWIREIRQGTSAPFAVNLIVDTLAIGAASTDEHIDLLVSERVPVVVFHWHRPPPAWVDRLQSGGCRVWMSVASAADAVAAARDGFDAVIAQGAEAGGHNRSELPLAELLAATLDAVGDTPVIAAGGISNGDAAAKALGAGASAVLIGTRFVASVEAWAHDEYKRRIVAAAPGDVATTTIFGPEWPGQMMRVLRNRAVRDAEAGRPPVAGPIGRTSLFGQTIDMPPHSALLPTPETTGDLDQMCLAAGEVVGCIDSVRPAAEIVHQIMADAAARLA